ncbi:patatin-like phospholipase family protein [Aquihabitans sp. G128]|uniref:patatin-like phospholipase family protein n=1 Tax=Aquihabitans sp. G128 TaxID=2849779 RepID=UPI001C220F01|nr:patatin-like phospholipase family protein [Aquihabitans sp. G128]QXC62227.1 patatin-like phospholipase family protein [Aquihabitans sp. G128]
MTTRALVLGGGGVTGIAWELGAVSGLLEAGVDVREADLVVGTSAGATVAAQITTGDLDELAAAQRSAHSAEIAAELDMDLMIELFTVLANRSIPADERRARVGARALATATVAEALRRDVIVARLPTDAWPAQPVVLTAVDASSGRFRTFDAASGVGLVDAVAASCAVPGIWPPVTIGDRRYLDGGVRSSANADLAAGHDRILVLTPMAPGLTSGLEDQVGRLRADGAAVVVVSADDAALARIGDNVLDPSRRGPAVEEGRRQGLDAAAGVAELWSAGHATAP